MLRSNTDLASAVAAGNRDRAIERRRQQAGPIGCGLFGIESLSQALRLVPRVESESIIKCEDIVEGIRLLQDAQVLNHGTRAVHAAAFYRPLDKSIVARQDVGRHNALDKVAGALGHMGAAAIGIILLTSRVSVELIQKAAMMGAPVLAAVSSPHNART